MRRIQRALLITVLALSAIAVIVPSAQARVYCYGALGYCDVTMDSVPNYKGWVHIDQLSCIALAGVSCDGSIQAWRWDATARQWRSTFINQQSDAYIYPYTIDWRWVWTKETGWVAARPHRFKLSQLSLSQCSRLTGTTCTYPAGNLPPSLG